jgi:hypothetical protein
LGVGFLVVCAHADEAYVWAVGGAVAAANFRGNHRAGSGSVSGGLGGLASEDGGGWGDGEGGGEPGGGGSAEGEQGSVLPGRDGAGGLQPESISAGWGRGLLVGAAASNGV